MRLWTGVDERVLRERLNPVVVGVVEDKEEPEPETETEPVQTGSVTQPAPPTRPEPSVKTPPPEASLACPCSARQEVLERAMVIATESVAKILLNQKRVETKLNGLQSRLEELQKETKATQEKQELQSAQLKKIDDELCLISVFDIRGDPPLPVDSFALE